MRSEKRIPATRRRHESRKNLKELLANRQANGIIFTTMQKFEESNEALSELSLIHILQGIVFVFPDCLFK